MGERGRVSWKELDAAESDNRVVNAERKERWRFHMSMKFEKMDVSAERSSRGSGVSRDAIIGVRNCCKPL